jgi:predicted Zn-dependent protease with MMP-like domain
MGATPSKWPSGTTAVGDRYSIGPGPHPHKSVHRPAPVGQPMNNEQVIEMTAERFEALVAASLDGVPADLFRLIDNCVVLVEDDPPEDEPDLLGLYDGTPLTERDSSYSLVLPDRITIFRNPLLQMCDDEEEIVEQVRITVVHEIAHHFGIDDERLHDLGYA